MFFISQNKDSSVKNLIENEVKKYNSKTDRDEVDETGYIVSQPSKFIVDKKLEIFGRVFTKSQKKYDDFNGYTKYDEKHVLEISSKKLSLLELQEWVDEKEKEHKKILKNKLLEEQMLIEISYNSKEKTIESIYNPWHSNATFDNRFFSGKEEIVNKINFFINNEQYFKDKGIPYTLGILLYGEPGCGKTGFIKSILNLTKRHGIKFNLSNKFDFTLMRDIIYDEEQSK
jgi:ATP-dependent 26S proteasome regulatory subunit